MRMLVVLLGLCLCFGCSGSKKAEAELEGRVKLLEDRVERLEQEMADIGRPKIVPVPAR